MATKGLRPRVAALVLAVPVLVAACLGQAIGQSSGAAATDSAGSPAAKSFALDCPYTISADRGTVPGVTVRSIDRTHVEISNATDRTYYLRVLAWFVYQLDCGRGLVDQEQLSTPIAPRNETLVGVPEGVPITVEIRDRPCGEGCTSVPTAVVVVPMSTLAPPVPGMS